MPFYKSLDNGIISKESLTITLTEENKDQHQYPIDGWHWFPDEPTARDMLKEFVYDPGSDEYKAMIKELFGRG